MQFKLYPRHVYTGRPEHKYGVELQYTLMIDDGKRQTYSQPNTIEGCIEEINEVLREKTA